MRLSAPATILPCRDGYVWMLAIEPGQWKGLVEVLGNPEWAQVEMFEDMFVRGQNADIIYPLLEEWTLQHDKLEIMERCQAAGCPATAVVTVEEAAEQPHLRERGYVLEVEHPELGRILSLAPPFKLPGSPGEPRAPAPLLGQHNDSIYGDRLGMRDEEQARLRADAII